jgi:hypothetical protein
VRKTQVEIPPAVKESFGQKMALIKFTASVHAFCDEAGGEFESFYC